MSTDMRVRRVNDTSVTIVEENDNVSVVTEDMDYIEETRSIFNTHSVPADQSNINMRTVMGERVVRHILRRAAGGVRVAGRQPIGSAQSLAQKYMNNPRYPTIEGKVKAMILHETAKGFACGFGTNIGGFWTALTVGSSAGALLSFVIQARLVSAIAILYGQNIMSQPVETLILLTMIGSSGMVSKIMRQSAQRTATRMTAKTMSKFVASSSGKTLTRIHQRVGVHILSKILPKAGIKTMSTTGSVVAPIVGNIAGGVLGGTIDAVSIRISAKFACKVFRQMEAGNYQSIGLDGPLALEANASQA